MPLGCTAGACFRSRSPLDYEFAANTMAPRIEDAYEELEREAGIANGLSEVVALAA